MIALYVVIGIVVALLVAVIVTVAMEPGPRAADVAIGYLRAVGAGDFDAMYRMIDPDLMRGRNRQDWIAAERAVPHAVYDPDAVRAVAVDAGAEQARVDVAVGAERVIPVELVLRSRVWVVTVCDGESVVGTTAR